MVSLPCFVALGLRPKCPQGTRFPSRLWTLETLARSGGGEARTHGASGGRGDAPTAAGAGACSGAFADWDKKHGPAGTAAGCGETRFLHPGCSIIRASPPVALMVSLPRFGSLWAFGPTAHRADASLRAPLDTRNARAQRAGRPAPMARAVGAGTRLPRRERAHAAGLLPTGTRSMARRGTAAGCGEARFAPGLLNHSRFPDGRAHGFAARFGSLLGLRPKCPQGTRFPARLSGARNARVACVRRKDGRCHSERSKGRDPLT